MNQENIAITIGIVCATFIVVVFIGWALGIFKKIRVFFHRAKIYTKHGDLWTDKTSDQIRKSLEHYKNAKDTDLVLIKILEEILTSKIKQEDKEEEKRKEFEMFGDQDDFFDKIVKFLGSITGLIIGTVLWGGAILIANALLTLIIPAVQVSIPFAVIVGFIVALVRYIQSKQNK